MSKSLADVLKENQSEGDFPGHLSASSVALHMRCPRQWQQSYVLGQKGDKSDALVIGSGTHLVLAHALKGEQVPEDWWEQACDGYVPDEASKGIAEAHAYHYWETIGKHLPVLETEKEFLVEVPGVELPLLGYIDIETETTLIDIKTTRYFSRKGVRPNKEWRLQQGIYQLVVKKPSEVHVLTRSKNDPVVVPDSRNHPLHFGLIDNKQIQEIVYNEWRRMNWYWEEYGNAPWPGNPMHEWNYKYCQAERCCKL